MSDIPPRDTRMGSSPAELWGRAEAFMAEEARRKREHRELQAAGAKASVESNKLLQKQLAEQIEINQRLEYEFRMGAREAVITRKIAYWSLAVGVIGVIIAILAFFRSGL